MTTDDAIRKIKKLAALAASNSPAEAAAALRQMQSMMRAFDIDDSVINDLTFRESANASGGERVAPWRGQLAGLVGLAFGTRMVQIISRNRQDKSCHRMQWIGERGACELSVYVYTVLLRQLIVARTKHLKRVRKATHRIARGDQFSAGWIDSVAQLLQVTEQRSPQLVAAINAYVTKLHPKTSEMDVAARHVDHARTSDRYHGQLAGRHASYATPLSGSREQQMQLELL